MSEVEHPQHYKLNSGQEALDVIYNCLTADEYKGFLRGNAFKYLIRYKGKGGVTDLRKAIFYTDKLAELLEIESELFKG